MYWAIGVSYLAISTAIYQYNHQPELSVGEHVTLLAGQFGPWIPSIVCILPLVMFDIVRLSNLFVGPIYRLRKHLNTLAEDPYCPPLKFRDGDYWHDLSVPINSMHAESINVRKENQQLKQKIDQLTAERERLQLEQLEGASEGVDPSTFLVDQVDAPDADAPMSEPPISEAPISEAPISETPVSEAPVAN